MSKEFEDPGFDKSGAQKYFGNENLCRLTIQRFSVTEICVDGQPKKFGGQNNLLTGAPNYFGNGNLCWLTVQRIFRK